MKKRITFGITIITLFLGVLTIICTCVFGIPVLVNFFDDYKRNTVVLTLDSTTDLFSLPPLLDISSLSKTTDILSLNPPQVQYAHGVNIITFNITNIKTRDELIISNQLPIEIISYEQEDNEVEDILQFRGGGGGGGAAWYFSVDLQPMVGERFYASYYDYQDPSTKPDYFYLAPGDTEVINVTFDFLSPGYYKFKVGVEYYDDDDVKIRWLDKEFNAFIPEEFYLWVNQINSLDSDLLFLGDCKFISVDYEDEDFPGYKCDLPMK